MKTLVLVVLYSISYGLWLLNDGLFQDDWTLYNMDPDVIVSIYHDQGHRWLASFHNYLLSFHYSILLYRGLCFTAYLAAALLLDGVLKRIKEISQCDRFFLVAVFALWPGNGVRFQLINLPYALCYALFFGGVYCLAAYSATRRCAWRLAALALFLISFDTNSMLVFYCIPVIWYLAERGRRWRKLLRYPDFLLLPLLYWLPKTILFVPRGAWEGYNAITLFTALKAPLFLILSYHTSFFKVLDYSAQAVNSLLLMIAFLLALLFYRRFSGEAGETALGLYHRGLVFGVVVFAAAVLPYNLVGLLPKLEEWHSRHQLLTPLGAGFLLVCGWSAIALWLGTGRLLRLWVLALALCLFTAVNTEEAVVFHSEWYKQQALIWQFRQNPVIAAHTTFLLEDRTPGSERRRHYPVYHYAGLLKQAFGEEKRIGIDISLLETNRYETEIMRFRKYFTRQWNAGEYQPCSEIYRVVVEPGPYKADRLSKVLSLKRHQLFNPAVYRQQLGNLISVRCQQEQ